MPCESKPIRYGHTEGHTEVCFDDSGRLIVTCGSDGDVRMWEGLDDDDPKFISVGEKVYSLALKKGKLVTASSSNTVQVHTFPDGDVDGILTRFTANATHVTFNSSGTRVAAGSSDFMIKVVEMSDSSQQKTLRGHEAPVLSVTFDPKDEFLASSSCDGSVVVWNIEEQTQLISWPLLQKTNEVSNAKSLCRLAWQPGTAKFLAVPVGTKVHLYERGSWDHVSTLSDDLLTQFPLQPVNVVAWSPCGKFLAAGSVAGSLTVWDVNSKLCVERQKHEKGFTVCGLAWHPSGGQIAYTDQEGCLGLLDGLSTNSTEQEPAKKPSKDYDELFDADDDETDGPNDIDSPVKKPVAVEDDDDDDDDDDLLLIPTGRVRNRGLILDDENSLDSGSLRLSQDKSGDDDDMDSTVLHAFTPLAPLRPVYEGPLPTPPQKAFQPGSTPAHLTHRFMMWNSVGIVRGYNDEQANAIEIEFHDVNVHPAVHLNNVLGHTIADVSQEAVLLACPSTDELASKVHCFHFSSWEINKDWTVDLPKDEDARALCLGQGWAAVATSAMMLRLFSISGLQREIFTLPGPVVCISGQGEQLLIVYHRATGFDGEQALGVQLLQLGQRKRQIINGEPLPLSPKSYLSWLGFTAEGTPCYVDSAGVVRLLNRSLGNTWTPVCNTRETCKSKSDHYWVVGLHENPQQLRCIPCKGYRYPPTLPRPTVVILPFKLPLCQMATEKGQMEEQFLRSVLFNNHYSFLSSSGYEIDEIKQTQFQKEQQALLMRMFALSCKLNREFRCVELAKMMSQTAVSLAIRYASRSRHMVLAQRLNEVALEKANQMKVQPEEEEEEEPEYSVSTPSQSEATGGRYNTQEEEQEDEDEDEVGEDEDRQEMETEEAAETRKRFNPFAKEAASFVTSSPTLTVGKAGRENPFKVPISAKPMTSSGRPRLGLNLLNKKPDSAALKSNKDQHPRVPTPMPKKENLFTMWPTSARLHSKKIQKQWAPNAAKPPIVPPQASTSQNTEKNWMKTGFQIWLDQNKNTIIADQPDLVETDFIKEAMGRFRKLSAEERQMWKEKAKSQIGEESDLKRRRGEGVENENEKAEVEDDENSTKRKKP